MTCFNGAEHSPMGTFKNGPSDVCFLGVPYDSMATGPGGQRQAPLAIRRAGEWDQDQLFDRSRKTQVATERYVDAGDVAVFPGRDDETIAEIALAAEEISHNTRRLVTFGGDNSVSKHVIEGLVRVIDPPHLVLFDAHADIWVDEGTDHATWVHDLIESGSITGASIFGTRGYISKERLEWADANRIQIFGVDECTPATVILNTSMASESSSVYLAVDIDVLDPAYGPGTGYPEPGGVSSRQLLQMVNVVLDNFDVPAMDITELLPLRDTSEITAKVANRIAVSSLFL